MITVVGLAGMPENIDFSEVFPSATIVARTSDSRMLVPVDHSYDRLFDSGWLAEVPDLIARDLVARGATTDIVYVVPGRGDVGDVTVEALAALTDVGINPAHKPLSPTGQLQVADALAIAIAEQRHPFDAGLAAIHPTVPLLVTNWTGRHVTALASRRLRRVYGVDIELYPDVNAELSISALAPESATASLSGLAAICAILRSPEGCPWDREQTISSVTRSLKEELDEFEVAVAEGDEPGQTYELGDVLMNLMLITQIAHEHGSYSLEDVVTSVAAKMIRRHPHVFGDLEVESVDEVLDIWRQVKASER